MHFLGDSLIKNIRHTGLVVRDINRAINFYEALGLRLWQRKIETGSYIENVVGISNVTLEWAKLKNPDGSLVEFLQYHSHPDNQSTQTKAPVNRLGCSHIAFTVEDINKTCDTIKRLGGSIVNSPTKSPGGDVSVAYCHDLDGILIEVVEELDING